jgi:hypothetical protein
MLSFIWSLLVSLVLARGLPPPLDFIHVVAIGECASKTWNHTVIPPCAAELLQVYKEQTRNTKSSSSWSPSVYSKTATKLLGGIAWQSRTILYSAQEFCFSHHHSDETCVLATTRREEWIHHGDDGKRVIYIAGTTPRIDSNSHDSCLGFNGGCDAQTNNLSCFNNDPITWCNKTEVTVISSSWSPPNKESCPVKCDLCCGCHLCDAVTCCIGQEECSCDDTSFKLLSNYSNGEERETKIDIDNYPRRFRASTETNLKSRSFLTLHTIKSLPPANDEFFNLAKICIDFPSKQPLQQVFPLSQLYNCNEGQC